MYIFCDTPHKDSEEDIKGVLDFLSCIQYLYSFKSVGNPMGTNCAPLLADLFLFSYEAELQKLLCDKNKSKV
jgi:hypothetical protein